MANKAKVLSKDDIKIILAVIDTSAHSARNRAIVMISMLAGLRAIEVASLTIGSVMGEDGKILDMLSFTKAQTKGNKSKAVPLSSRLAKELKAYIASLHPRSIKQERPLFVSQKGSGFTAHGIVMLLKRIYQSAGIQGASSHSGRRSFASNLASKGISVFVLKELMSHSSIQTTAGYVDTGEHLQRNAVELL